MKHVLAFVVALVLALIIWKLVVWLLAPLLSILFFIALVGGFAMLVYHLYRYLDRQKV